MMRRFRIAAVATMLAGLLAVVAPATASACSCATSDLADRLAADGIATVFTGTPAHSEMPAGPVTRSDELETWTFDVDAVHRGEVPRVTEIRTPLDESSCGIDFVVDRRYLVVTRVDENGIGVAALCGGSAPVDELSAGDLALLGPGRPPADSVTAPVADPTPGVWSSPTSWVVAAVLGTVLAGAVVVAVRRRPGG